MDETELKHVLEAALLAAGRPLSIDQLAGLFVNRASVDRALVRQGLERLAEDYAGRGIEIKEVASGYRIQVRRTMTGWLTPLWEERAPRYTRALLETLALIVYRQPITRGEIEEIRGVVVSPNIIRTLMERNWVRVVGHRDVPGKPEMFGTTKDFLDYFGLRRLEDLPPLSEIKDLVDPNSGLEFPATHPQAELIDATPVSLADLTGAMEPGNSPASEGAAVWLPRADRSEGLVAKESDFSTEDSMPFDSSSDMDPEADVKGLADLRSTESSRELDSDSAEDDESTEDGLSGPVPHAAGPR